MAIRFQNNADAGTSGTAVTIGNSGGASGDPWQNVSTGTGNTITFDSTAAHGGLSYKVVTGTTANSFLQATGLTVSTNTRMVTDFAFRMGALPTTQVWQFARFTNSAGASLATLGMAASGGIMQVINAAAVVQTASNSPALSANTWYRVVFACTPGTTTSNGTIELAIYLLGSRTPIWTWSSSAQNAGTTAVERLLFGALQTPTQSKTGWFDDIRVGDLVSGDYGLYTDLDVEWDIVSDGSSDIGKAAPTIASTTSALSLYSADVQARLNLAATSVVVSTYVAGGIVRQVPIASLTAAVSTTSAALGVETPLATTVTALSTYASSPTAMTGLAAGATAAVTTTSSTIGVQPAAGSFAIASTTTVVTATSCALQARLGLAATTPAVTGYTGSPQALDALASRTDAVTTTGGGPLTARLGLAGSTPVVSTVSMSPAARIGMAAVTAAQTLYSADVLARYAVGSTTVVITGGASDIGAFDPAGLHDFAIFLVREKIRQTSVVEAPRAWTVHELVRQPNIQGDDMILRHGDRDFYRFSIATLPAITGQTLELSFDEGATWVPASLDPDNPDYWIVLVRHPAFVDNGTPASTLIAADTKPRIRVVGSPVDVWYPGPIIRVEA